jgi:hypothetical protein
MIVIFENMVPRRIPIREGDEVTREERHYLKMNFTICVYYYQTLLRGFT